MSDGSGEFHIVDWKGDRVFRFVFGNHDSAEVGRVVVDPVEERLDGEVPGLHDLGRVPCWRCGLPVPLAAGICMGTVDREGCGSIN